MENKCVKSIGLDASEYEENSLIIIDDIKRLREEILTLSNSEAKWNLLFELLMAIDSLLRNKEAFHMCVSLAISKSDKYMTVTYYEGENLHKRIYDDVALLPTILIIANDFKSFYFLREKNVLPNPENRGRRVDFEVRNYTIKDDKVTLKKGDNTNFSFKINDECLYNSENFVAELKKKL